MSTSFGTGPFPVRLNPGRWGAFLLLALAVSRVGAAAPEPRGPGVRAPAPGEAVIRYLHHSGWAVKTADHLLIFDYTEPPDVSSGRTLDAGFVDPSRIADENVIVFVSHSHGDHYDRRILEWRRTIPKLRYVWGWEEAGASDDLHFGGRRRSVAVEGVEVMNVHHAFDGVPESAFLVKADGLTIVHSGDHGSSRGLENPVFADNLNYLAGLARQPDLLFVPDFGGAAEAVGVLRPRAVFPMHDGGRERRLADAAERIRAVDPGIAVGVAGAPGDQFLYSGGRIVSLLPDRLAALLRDNAFDEADRLAARLGDDPAAGARTRALCGLAALEAGRIGEAEAILREAVAEAPDTPEAHLGLGRIHRIRNEPDEALAHLRQAVASDDLHDDALFWLWRAARERGEVDELLAIRDQAERWYRSASKPLPGWIVNGSSQVERLAGRRLYEMAGEPRHVTVPIVTLEGSGIPVVELSLDGKGAYPFHIDSASPDFMNVSPLLAEELGLAMTGGSSAIGVGTGSARVRFSVLDTVAIQGIVFRNVPVMVSDLVTFRGRKVGLIGTGFLKRFNVTIDVRAGLMDLHPLDRPDRLGGGIDPAAVAATIPLYIFDATTVEASIGGAPPALFILDTAASTNLVDTVFFERHLKQGVDPSRIVPRRIAGLGGEQRADRIEGLSIALGPLDLPGQAVHLFSMKALNDIGDRYAAGLIGNPALRPYRVHMDFRGGRLILEKYPQ